MGDYDDGDDAWSDDGDSWGDEGDGVSEGDSLESFDSDRGMSAKACFHKGRSFSLPGPRCLDLSLRCRGWMPSLMCPSPFTTAPPARHKGLSDRVSGPRRRIVQRSRT